MNGHDHMTHLTSKDDNFIDRSHGLIFQKLADDEAACNASTDNSEVLVTGHVFV